MAHVFTSEATTRMSRKADPLNGERYINIKAVTPWTIRVIGMIYRESVREVNPEFYCEVRFIYESSGHDTEMPLSWFHEVYRKIDDANRSHRYSGDSRNQGGAWLNHYSWLDNDD